MIKSRNVRTLPVLLCFMVLSACDLGHPNEAEQFADDMVNLGWVSGAVQGYVEFDPNSLTTPDHLLLSKATAPNPKLFETLRAYSLKARRVGQLSSVLMCDVEQKRAIAEDAGCTSSKPDLQHWRSKETTPCEFKLDLNKTCSQ